MCIVKDQGYWKRKIQCINKYYLTTNGDSLNIIIDLRPKLGVSKVSLQHLNMFGIWFYFRDFWLRENTCIGQSVIFNLTQIFSGSVKGWRWASQKVIHWQTIFSALSVTNKKCQKISWALQIIKWQLTYNKIMLYNITVYQWWLCMWHSDDFLPNFQIKVWV